MAIDDVEPDVPEVGEEVSFGISQRNRKGNGRHLSVRISAGVQTPSGRTVTVIVPPVLAAGAGVGPGAGTGPIPA